MTNPKPRLICRRTSKAIRRRLWCSEGRSAIEQRITQKAQQDPVFAHNLVARPRQTPEAFLGVKIPETVSLAPIIENPQRFVLVIPMPVNYLSPD